MIPDSSVKQQTNVAEQSGLTRVTDRGDVTRGFARRDGRHWTFVTCEALNVTESGIKNKKKQFRN